MMQSRFKYNQAPQVVHASRFTKKWRKDNPTEMVREREREILLDDS